MELNKINNLLGLQFKTSEYYLRRTFNSKTNELNTECGVKTMISENYNFIISMIDVLIT